MDPVLLKLKDLKSMSNQIQNNVKHFGSEDRREDKPAIEWAEGKIVVNGQTLTILFPEEE